MSAANYLWFLSASLRMRRWEKASREVARSQWRILHRILQQNADTEFGREHQFEKIGSVKDFQRLVPVRDYEGIAPYIERIASGSEGVLTRERVLRFAPSSGTTSASKLIPTTRSLIQEFQEGIDPWYTNLIREFPGLLRGKAYWSVTPVGDTPQVSAGKIPIGFDDERAYFNPLAQWALRSIMPVPSAVARIRDMDVFRYTTLRLLIQEPHLAWISVWNPTFLLLLLGPLQEWSDRLIEDMERGALSVSLDLDTRGQRIIHAALQRNPRRASLLQDILNRWQGRDPVEVDHDGKTLYEAIWPQLSVVSCWAHGAARDLLPSLNAILPHAAIQPKGLLATESFVSFPFSGEASALSLLSHFLEFQESSGEVPAAALLAHELQVGKQYNVVVTTGGGLYRYSLNDRIEVLGFHKQCPLIRFMGRTDRVVDQYGEKLNEQFVREAFEKIQVSHRLPVSFWMLAPGQVAPPQHGYTLFLQLAANHHLTEEELLAAAADLDRALGASYHYAYCRRLGQLDSCQVFVIDPAVDAARVYLTACARLGQRLGNIKPAALHSYSGWAAEFSLA